jgi:excisionase family DNA binding protein
MPEQAQFPAYLSPAAVARRLGVTPQTVRNHVRNGRLRGYRIGRQLRVDPADLAAYIKVEQPGGSA